MNLKLSLHDRRRLNRLGWRGLSAKRALRSDPPADETVLAIGEDIICLDDPPPNRASPLSTSTIGNDGP